MSERLRRIWEGIAKESEIDIWEKNQGHHSVLPKKEFKHFLRQLKVHLDGVRVLFPCPFSGEYLRIVQDVVKHPHNVIALDIAKSQIKRSGAKHGVVGDAKELPFRDNAFTHIITYEPTPLLGLYGLKATLQTLKEFIRVTRPGGAIVFLHSLVPHTMPGIAEMIRALGIPVVSQDISNMTTDKAAAMVAFITDEKTKKEAVHKIEKLLKAGQEGKWDMILRSRAIQAYLRAYGVQPEDLREEK